MTEVMTSADFAGNSDQAVTMVKGKEYMQDAKGNLVPIEAIKPADRLEDEVVRKIMVFASSLSEQISRFRGHTMTDLGEFDALLQQEYNATKGGPKGNRTYQTFDGLKKVTIQIADFVDFGPQLQVAKRLLDECLTEWPPTAAQRSAQSSHAPSTLTRKVRSTVRKSSCCYVSILKIRVGRMQCAPFARQCASLALKSMFAFMSAHRSQMDGALSPSIWRKREVA